MLPKVASIDVRLRFSPPELRLEASLASARSIPRIYNKKIQIKNLDFFLVDFERFSWNQIINELKEWHLLKIEMTNLTL